jgi:glycosyltransferase involved in cell wall biosynthesis
MNALPKISIITPTFNAAATIAACIESVATQTYPNKEHWIIDGLSTDDTMTIVRRYAAIYPHIRYLSEKDQGIYDAMNKGIRLSEGEWLYFLGADDSLYKNSTLFEASKYFQHHDILYGNVEMIDYATGDSFIYDGEFNIQKIQHKNICHQAIFFHKKVFKKLGLFNLSYPINADWEFNFRWIFNQRVQARYVNQIIALFNRTGTSYRKKDESFKNQRDYLILKYGRSVIPNEQRSYMFYTYILNASGKNSLPRKIVRKAYYLLYKHLGIMPKVYARKTK